MLPQLLVGPPKRALVLHATPLLGVEILAGPFHHGPTFDLSSTERAKERGYFRLFVGAKGPESEIWVVDRPGPRIQVLGRIDFGVGFGVLVKAIRIAVASGAHVRAATLVVRGTKEEDGIVRVLQTNRANCVFPFFLLIRLQSLLVLVDIFQNLYLTTGIR